MAKKRKKSPPAAVPAQAPPPRPEASDRGIECPRCGCRHFEVVYTRPVRGGRVQRRRQCRHCGRRITTVEKPINA
jgi:transcription elongation factor Elf1